MAIDGTYIMVSNTPMGRQETKLEVKTQGNVVTGSATGTSGTDKIEDGKVDGQRCYLYHQLHHPLRRHEARFQAHF